MSQKLDPDVEWIALRGGVIVAEYKGELSRVPGGKWTDVGKAFGGYYLPPGYTDFIRVKRP